MTVVGGLSKMLSYFKQQNIYTYADRRYSTAIGYLKSGFKLLGITKPGYEYMFDNGYRRLWNSGHYKLLKVKE